MLTHHKFVHIRVHMAACLNEEIARKLSPDGLHAAVIVGDASTSTTNVVISETIKHLDVDLFSLFLSVVNLIRPAGIVYDTVVERIDQLAASYNFPVVNILIEDEKSVASGVGRILTAAMRSAGFVAGFVPMTLNDEHVPEDVIDQTQLQNQTRPS